MKKIFLLLTASLLILVLSVPVMAVDSANKAQMKYSEAKACVKEKFPAERYSTNEYLPDPKNSLKKMKCKKVDRIKVGTPWVLDDGGAAWYNAIELGYYKDVCLDVKLVAGGPGVKHLQTLGAGAMDVAISAGGAGIPLAVASRTPIDVVAVATFLKGMPYAYITVLPELQEKKLTPLDLIGRRIATGGEQGKQIYVKMMLDKYGIARDKVEAYKSGHTPDDILVGAKQGKAKADFKSVWIQAQPRQVEEKGFKWNALMYRDWVYDEYSSVITVRRKTLEAEKGRDLVRRFLAATYKGVEYLLENPDKTAEIAQKYATGVKLNKKQILSAFRLQEALVRGRDGLGLMHMSSDNWNEVVSNLAQYGLIEIPGGCN